jgi:hypothetical protein
MTAATLFALAGACSGCLGVVALRPELRNAAIEQDALALSDALEKLIDAGKDTPEDREAAYENAVAWKKNTAEYAYARAALAGRLAELKGLKAINLITDVERWARMSMALNPGFRRGAARRMLGTLYALAPARLVKFGDSEDGLELLEEQVEKYSGDVVNHLRLAQGFVSLNDHEGAFEALCRCLEMKTTLRSSDQALLESLVTEVGGPRALMCGDDDDDDDDDE